jgi:IS30 family transposase
MLRLEKNQQKGRLNPMTKDTLKPPHPYRHLTIEEREEIAVGLAKGLSFREIGRRLKRNASTITRELRRSYPPKNKVHYRATTAQKLSRLRLKNSHSLARLKSDVLRNFVIEKLKIGWSPEIIAGYIKQNPSLNLPLTNYESIYQWIYSERKDLVHYLPRSHRKRRKRGSATYKHASKIPNRTPIENRPKSVEFRKEPGHFEADTAVSRQSKAAISVVIDRSTRFVVIRKIESKSAVDMERALILSLQNVPSHLRKSITYDNGTENTHHHAVNDALGTLSFFCNPYHSWEKGSVEHVIGLIRRTYPM